MLNVVATTIFASLLSRVVIRGLEIILVSVLDFKICSTAWKALKSSVPKVKFLGSAMGQATPGLGGNIPTLVPADAVLSPWGYHCPPSLFLLNGAVIGRDEPVAVT